MSKVFRMQKSQAEDIVASLLAMDTVKWMNTIKENPSLATMSREAIARNRDVAIAMKIDSKYSQKLAIHLS